MLCKKKYWILAFAVGLIAVSVGLFFHSPCMGSMFLLERAHSLFTFYGIAWRMNRLYPFAEKVPVQSTAKLDQHILSLGLLWMAPFISGGGYCSEALAYVLGLARSGLVPYLRIEQHGDMVNEVFWSGLPSTTRQVLIRYYYSLMPPLNNTIVICHSEPGAWYPPLFETVPCPPTGYEEPYYVIGRTMFETDRLTAEHARRCNNMDEVWVPSDFNRETFARSGVDPSKLVKVVQPVDVRFFDPAKIKLSGLPLKHCNMFCGGISKQDLVFLPKGRFVFLSIFKWELRKGWDVLVEAYMREFSAKDNVALYVSTAAYHSELNYEDQVMDILVRVGLKEPEDGWPALFINDDHVPQVDMPKLYKSSNAFVLPSRGEGWGRPHVEAMSMGLPVIATNWSGIQEYMSEANSYPLPVERLVQIQEGSFKGHLWAQPSVESLQKLMRHVLANPAEAKAKGKLARQTMVTRFSPEVVIKDVVQNLFRVSKEGGRRKSV